ncbi:hypothetical protein BJX63DRAFT_370267 [Aspergillus granulosus]|uniref:Uncharacterized protein n=1 Tax=Aspergillus granulosus TaxID=176169 RepID=A0ABR4H1A9_9EURO
MDQPKDKSQDPRGKDNFQDKRKRAKVDSTMAPTQSPNDHSPQPKRKRLVDSLEEKSTSQPSRSAKPGASKSRDKPSRTQDSQAIEPRPRTPKKVLQSDAKRNPASIAAPINIKKPRSNPKGAVGQFRPEEVEALESFKLDFCNTNNCSTVTFDQMVQHGRQEIFPGQRWISKKAFWKSVFEILPDRDQRSVLRFMKRHFQASDLKSHVWTDEQDAELVVLIKQHGTKYALVAEMLGRSSDDVVQRWKNRLEHQDKMKTGPWSNDELDALQSALTLAWTRSKDKGLDVGENIYEMAESLISWGQVSKSMGHVRSRQQCADKWRRVKKRLNSGSQPNSRSATPAIFRQPKSAEYVESDGDDSDEQEGGVDSQQKGSTSVQRAKKSPTKKKQQPREESSSKRQSGSGSEPDSDPRGDAEGDSSSASESDSEEEQTTAKISKSGSSLKDRSSLKSKGKPLSGKKPQPDSSSVSGAEENESGESTTDESSDSSSEESGSTDDSESDSESEGSSAEPATRDAQNTTKRKRESATQDDEMETEMPAKIIKNEPTSDGESEDDQKNDKEDEEESDEESDVDDDDVESGPYHKAQKDVWFTSKVKTELSEDVPIRKREP